MIPSDDHVTITDFRFVYFISLFVIFLAKKKKKACFKPKTVIAHTEDVRKEERIYEITEKTYFSGPYKG